MDAELRNAKNLSDKHLVLFLLMNEWVKAKQRNMSIPASLEQRGYKTIGIYGMSYAGQRLFDELENTNIEVKYCIDRNAGGIYKTKRIIAVDEINEDVDCIVVTPVFYFEEIAKDLKKKVNAKVISLEEIIYGLTVGD